MSHRFTRFWVAVSRGFTWQSHVVHVAVFVVDSRGSARLSDVVISRGSLMWQSHVGESHVAVLTGGFTWCPHVVASRRIHT